MAKSKNHTARNQTVKNHRNGIKKPKRNRYRSLKGMDPKFLKNLRFAKKHNKKGRPDTQNLENEFSLVEKKRNAMELAKVAQEQAKQQQKKDKKTEEKSKKGDKKTQKSASKDDKKAKGKK